MATTVVARYLLASLSDDTSSLVGALAPLTTNGIVLNQGPLLGLDSTNNIVGNYHLLLFFYLTTNDSAIRTTVQQNTVGFNVPVTTWAQTSVQLG